MSGETIAESCVDVKIIGVGAAGINAVEYLKRSGLTGVSFIGIDTDALTLHSSELNNKLLIGESLINGMGAGGNPMDGRNAAVSDKRKLSALLKGTDLVFFIAGLGGGTGSGALPYIARIASELEILSIGAVTTPFEFEGKARDRVAQQSLDELTNYIDTYLEISNEKISRICGLASVEYGIKAVRNRLLRLVMGAASLLIRPSTIHLDLADLRTVFSEAGALGVGGGMTAGEARAQRAASAAMRNLTPDYFDLSDARTMLVSVITGAEISLGEFSEIGDVIWGRSTKWNEELVCIVGATIDPEMKDEICVVVMITRGWTISESSESKSHFAQAFARNKQRTVEWFNQVIS